MGKDFADKIKIKANFMNFTHEKFVGKRENFRLKKEEELSPAVKSLIGIANHSGKDEDINGRDARMEFLSEKYGL